MTEKLTPTEDLILDLLVARYRLGEYQWPLSNKLVNVIHSLAARGYVNSRHGNVEKTYLVRLTDEAVAEFVTDSEYTPQGYREHAEKIAEYMDHLGFEPNIARVIRKQFGKGSR